MTTPEDRAAAVLSAPALRGTAAPAPREPTSAPLAAGRIARLARWPVKSFAGEELRAARLDRRGLAGDRTYALIATFRGERQPLTARGVPRMLEWSAAYPDGADDAVGLEGVPEPVLTAPDGRRLGWSDPALPALLAQDLRREVALHREPEGQQDISHSILVTTEASRAALEAELGRPVDIRRFRPNLHLELDAPAFAEHDWEGGSMALSGLELELLEPCPRCAIPARDPDTNEKWSALVQWIYEQHQGQFGIYARARQPGRVAVGQDVRVLSGADRGRR